MEISLGDFLNKGPNSIETLRFIKKSKILAIRGNHEDKFIRYDLHENIKKRFGKKNPMKLTPLEKEIYQSLNFEDLKFLKSLPFYIKIGSLTVVHAGVTNTIFLENATKKEFAKVMRVRFVDENGEFVALDEVNKKACCYWSEVYDGHEGFIVYGHQPFLKPKIDRFSIGIDTGCVYGNMLSAVIFEKNEDEVIIPSYRFESVKAKKAYAKREKPWMI